MTRLCIASTRKSSGKTGLILGLHHALGRSAGYIKPLGDRLLYRKKRLWDFDAAVVTSAFGTGAPAEDLTIGFEPAKLRYMYDEEQVGARVLSLASANEEGRDLLFVEGGRDLAHGTSVHLDPLSVARKLGAKLLLVAGGDEDTIVDDVAHVCHRVDRSGVEILGVVCSKVRDPDDFAVTHRPALDRLGIEILGVLPHEPLLCSTSVDFVAGCVFARVLAGEENMGRRVARVFVGAASADAALRDPAFRSPGNLVITSGDRSDMILAALECNPAGILLTKNVLPPPNIVSRVTEAGVPLLLVPADTFQAAKQVDDMEPLVTRDDTDKLERLRVLVAERVDVGRLQARL